MFIKDEVDVNRLNVADMFIEQARPKGGVWQVTQKCESGGVQAKFVHRMYEDSRFPLVSECELLGDDKVYPVTGLII